MFHTLVFASALLLLGSTVHAATVADVISSNNALTQQAVSIDDAVVDITAATPPTTAQEVPTALQSLTNSFSSSLAALNPTPATSDPPTESAVFESFGKLANTIEELMDDYSEQKSNLIGVFGLQTSIYNNIIAFNTTFQEYATFMGTVVTDATIQTSIIKSNNDTIGVTNGDGINLAASNYA